MICLRPCGPQGLQRPLGCSTVTPAAFLVHRRGVAPLQQRTCLWPRSPHLVQSPTIVAASKGDQAPENTPQSSGVTTAARQLLSVTALAFFTLVATVARDRVTSPIVPPYLPYLEASNTGPDDNGTAKSTTVMFEAPEQPASTSTKARVKPSRSLLRVLWGTATLPVKLLDNVLFPEEALVGTKQVTSAETPAAQQHKQQLPSSSDPSSSQAAAGSSTAAPAAAEQHLGAPGIDRSVAASSSSIAPEGAVSDSSSPDVWQQLQQALAHVTNRQQADDGGSNAAAAASPGADHAAVLAAVRFLMGGDSSGVLPVLLVTSLTAAAGLMLAAVLAGLAGLVDGRRATTPAQRAAQAALLDSPLRPISCYTWPGFLPMLPASIGPNYYRWREPEDAAAAGDASNNSCGSHSNSNSAAVAADQPAGAAGSAAPSTTLGDGAAAAAARASPQAAEKDEEWWSFAQIAALRMMPLLPGGSSSKQGTGSSNRADTAAAATSAVTAAAAAAAPAAVAHTFNSDVPSSPAQAAAFEQVQAELTAAVATGLQQYPHFRMNTSQDATVLLGAQWDMAMQLVACDAVAAPDVAWGLFQRFGSTATPQLVAEVCCLLPAAVVNCRATAAPRAGPAQQQEASESCWAQASRLLAMLLRDAGPAGLQAVAEEVGLLAAEGSQQRRLMGVLQQRCQQYLVEDAELQDVDALVYGEVPGVQSWLRQCKQQRMAITAVALQSSIMAAYACSEMLAAAALRLHPQKADDGGELLSGAVQASSATASTSCVPSDQHLKLQPLELLGRLMSSLSGHLEARTLASAVLDLSVAPTRPVQQPHLVAALFANPGGLDLQSTAHMEAHARLRRDSALQQLNRDQVLQGSLNLQDALDAAMGGEMEAEHFALNEEEVLEDVVAGLQHGVLAVKPPQAVLLWEFRAEWPAAQQLALIDSMVLPSTSAQLLRLFAHSADKQMLARTCALLPAGVVHVSSFRQQSRQQAKQDPPGRTSYSQDPTAACMRMYTALLARAFDASEDSTDLPVVFEALGLNPMAVAAVAAAARQPGASPVAAAAAVGVGGQQHLQHLPGDSLLQQVYDGYMNHADSQDFELEIGHAVLLSTTVCLAMLLQLAHTQGWDMTPTTTTTTTTTDVSSNASSSTGTAAKLLPGWFWALLAAHFAESNLRELPGGLAVATLLQAVINEAEASAAAHCPTEVMRGADYALACEQLQVAVDGYLPDHDDTEVSCRYDSWQSGLGMAIRTQDSDLGIQEQELEEEDFAVAVEEELLPWLQVTPAATFAAAGASSRSRSSDVVRQDSSCGESGREEGGSGSGVKASEDSTPPSADVSWEEQEEELLEEEQEWEEEEEGSDAAEDEFYADEDEQYADDYDVLDEADLSSSSSDACQANQEAAAAATTAAGDAAAYQEFRTRLGALTSGHLLPSVQQLAAADSQLGEAWEVALLLVLCDAREDDEMTQDVLQQFVRVASLPLVAEVCVLLPAAVVNTHAATAAVRTARTQLSKGWAQHESSWDAAARMLRWLLVPSSGAAAGDISLLSAICTAMGLCCRDAPTHNYRHLAKPLCGVLQRFAAALSAADAGLARQQGQQWGPAGAGLQQWLLRPKQQAHKLSDMALRSCVMASYLAFECWCQNCSPFEAQAHKYVQWPVPKPAVLFSHIALLQGLQTQHGQQPLHKLVALASQEASNPASCNDMPTRPVTDSTSQQVYALLVRNGGCDSHFTGKGPEAASTPAFLACVEAVQQDMAVQLASPHLQEAMQAAAAAGPKATAAAPAADAEEQELLDDLVEYVIRGQQVVPLRSDHHLVWLSHAIPTWVAARPEWSAAVQLYTLHTLLPEATSKALLQRFAAAVSDRCLARVCVLLPAAACMDTATDHDVAVNMLDVLAAAPEGPGSVAALMPHLGLQAPAVAAAVAAARAAGGCTHWLDAAAAAIADQQVEQPAGFLQELWQFGKTTADKDTKYLERSAVGVLVYLCGMLDCSSNSVEGMVHSAAAAAAGPTAPGNDSSDSVAAAADRRWLLPSAGWAALEACYREHSMQFTGQSSPTFAEAAAAVALLQRGKAVALTREREQPLESITWNIHLDRRQHEAQPVSSKEDLSTADAAVPPAPAGVAPSAAAAASGDCSLSDSQDDAVLMQAQEGEEQHQQPGGAASGDADTATVAGEQFEVGRYTSLNRRQQDEQQQQQEDEVPEAAGSMAAGGQQVLPESASGGSSLPTGFDNWLDESVPWYYEINSGGLLGGAAQQDGAMPAWPNASAGYGGLTAINWNLDFGFEAVEDRSGSNRKKKRQAKKKKKQQQGQQQSGAAEPTAPAEAALSEQGEQGKQASAAAAVKVAGPDECQAEAAAQADADRGSLQPTAAQLSAATADAQVVPYVKQLLGLLVDPADAALSTNSSEQLPNRLALLLCQAMLMRGDDAQHRLQEVVRYLVAAQGGDCLRWLQLPVMLSGCMEALFTTEDWDSHSGSAQQVLSSLSDVLPAEGYLDLQKQLMAKGLIKELEVPAEFD